IQELYWQQSQLQHKDPAVQLPPKFNVISGQIADLTGDGKLENAYIRNGVLWIYSGKKRLYASPKQMGGSLSILTYKVDPTLLDYRTTSVFFEIAPVAVDVDGDGRKELLGVSSDQSSFKIPGITTTIDKSWIMVFDYEEENFVKSSLTPQVSAAIQGLGVTDHQLLLVTTDTGDSPEAGGSSRLHSVDLTLQ
ncbi:MAG TPA: hypothetical protein VJ969_04860, partial [Desulfopila sp.]|nr:hypothetical protein [Desulfopila sp.]